MTVFVLCSATAAAAMAVAFEVGRTAEKRLSGASKNAQPFEGFDWQSEQAKMATFVFGGLLFVEMAFLPRAWNPFSYIVGGTTSAYSSLLAFLVFGSWSGILAVGFGGMATSFQALNLERKALDRAHSDLKAERTKHDQELEKERQEIEKNKRTNLASAAAVAGEWKKFHNAREEDLHRNLERSENEKIWSKTITEGFDKKVMHVVENATEKRWREIQDQDLTLEAMRFRNREKEKQLKEQKAARAERATNEKETLKNETSQLLKMADDFENLKSDMDKLKEENTKKEQQKIQELKDREMAIQEKEKELAKTHQQKLEELKEQETKLKTKEEELDSGEELKKLQELSAQLESSKLTVAKFNEEVMKKEKEKLEEFRLKELQLQRREDQIAQNVLTNSPRDTSSRSHSYFTPRKNISRVESIAEDRNDDVSVSDSVTVSHMIQRDIAAVGRNTIIKRSTHFNVPTPLSPLQETFRQTFFAAKKQKSPKNIASRSSTIPKNTSAARKMAMDSMPTYDSVSMTTGTEYGGYQRNSAYQRSPRAVSPSPMSRSAARRYYAKGKKSMVLSEGSAVEVAWNDPGTYSPGTYYNE